MHHGQIIFKGHNSRIITGIMVKINLVIIYIILIRMIENEKFNSNYL